MEGIDVAELKRELGMEEMNAISGRKGKTVQRTSPLVYRAVEVLMDHFKPLEIMELLGLKRRTTYYIIERIRQAQYERRTAEAERERREREKCERCKEGMREVIQAEVGRESLSLATLREGWQRPSRGIRRFRS